MTWYSKLKNKTAVVGLTPFDGTWDLTEKSRYVHPMGGDTYNGVLSPSDNSETHHPSDYFSEGDKTPLVERLLENKKLEEKTKKKKKKKIKQKFSEGNIWYRQAQWGTGGPKLPVFNADDWVTETYKQLSDFNNDSDPDQNIQEEASNLEESVVDISGNGTAKGFFINSNIILTSNSVSESDQITISHNGESFKASVLTSNPNLDVSALVVQDPNFHTDSPAKFGNSDRLKPTSETQPVPGSPAISDDNSIVGIMSSEKKIIPSNSIKAWLRDNGLNFEEI